MAHCSQQKKIIIKMESFKSKYCVPKKLPNYFQEFITFIQAMGRIGSPEATSVISQLTRSWPDYSACGKERKARATKASKSDDDAISVQSPENTLALLRDYINKHIEDQNQRTIFLQVLHNFNTQ